ncbi:universal stress protein [Streptomyces sp. SKN60]|uniref:universal stress protein n=1 Tax=Streptomyces sp. SKN60 TaxID=2855506 RepID=UPI002246843B|nr:universal stress protein [Streptomyces sp. SKN60]MCX2181415.1 universal stress protein [Streptomyces sp. SKN60]
MDGTTDRPAPAFGPRPGRIVVGVDGSPSADAAVAWAAREAALWRTGLCIVHATDTSALYLRPEETERLVGAGRELLDRAARTVTARHPQVPVVTELDDGTAPAALRAAAALTGMIVVGHRGLGGFSSLVLGSVGLELAAAATAPVVVIRGTDEPRGDSDAPQEPYERYEQREPYEEPAEPAEAGVVLAAVRDAHDEGCARAAAREALLRKVPLRLVHVWSTLPYLGGLRAPAGVEQVRPLTGIAAALRAEFPDLTVDTVGEKDRSVPGALVEASRHADLLVAGGRRAPGYLGPTLGRTTLGLLQHAHCPVELIPRHTTATATAPDSVLESVLGAVRGHGSTT